MSDSSDDNNPVSVNSASVQTDETRGGAFVNYAADITDETDVQIRTTTSIDIKINPVFDEKSSAVVGRSDVDDNRETWGKKADFLLSVIGFAVDLANVWRFPYLCYRNGGGAFLIPYVIFLIVGGIPMLYMELALGQYHRTGAISVWTKMCPLFKGVGWAVVLIAWYVAMYYNVIIAWAVYYLVSSFTKNLPWTGCTHAWNTPYCYDSQVNETFLQVNGELVQLNYSVGSTSAEEFFNRGVLGVHNSDGIDDLGGIKWQLLVCLIGVLIVVYFSIWKGVKTSGKVVWVTATLPYLVITILLIRGVTLPGSAAGIRYYLTPDFNRLKNAEVWIDAAIQIFYSIGAGFGVHIAYASYNKFNNNIYRDAILTSSVNCVTSFFSGFAIFAVLGYMSNKLQRPIEDVATDGPGLVFIVYPEALATLPGAQGWSILFYIMLITLGLDSSFGGMEAVITGLTDEFPTVFRKRRELLVAGVCCSVFLFALFNVTYGGLYVFTLQDKHFAGTSLLFVVTVEVIAVSWFYGLTNFCQDVERMIGTAPGLWWRICWKVAAPLFLVFIFLVSVILSGPLTLDNYIYPDWANVVGWCLTASSMVLVPLFAVYEISKANGKTLREKFLISITPVVDESLLIEEGNRKRLKAKHWLSI